MTPEQEKLYQKFLNHFNKLQRPLFEDEFEEYKEIKDFISEIKLILSYHPYTNYYTLYLPDENLYYILNKICQVILKKNDEIKINEFYYLVVEGFLSYYNLYELIGRIIYQHKNTLYIQFFGVEFSWKFAVIDQFTDFLIENRDKYRITKKDKDIFVESIIRFSEKNQKIFLNSILEVFRDIHTKTIQFNELILELELILKELKPINYYVIETVIKNNPLYFNFDEQSKIVNILSDEEIIEKIQEYFKNNQKLVNEFGGVIEESGFIALTFIGKNFPFSEAAEYVKTRPIIFVDSILDKTDLETYISFSNEDLINPEVPDTKYLKIFNLEDDVKNWIVENCYISFLPYDRDRVKLLFPKLVEKLSPVLNLSSSANNLFEYTLKQKINEYLSSKGLLENNG